MKERFWFRLQLCIAGYEYDGGIIITASHLPFNRNGFKFFTKEGGLEKANIKDLLQRAAAAAHSAGLSPNARHTDDASVMDAALSIDPSSTPKVSSTCFLFMPQLVLQTVSWMLHLLLVLCSPKGQRQYLLVHDIAFAADIVDDACIIDIILRVQFLVLLHQGCGVYVACVLYTTQLLTPEATRLSEISCSLRSQS